MKIHIANSKNDSFEQTLSHNQNSIEYRGFQIIWRFNGWEIKDNPLGFKMSAEEAKYRIDRMIERNSIKAEEKQQWPETRA